MVKRFDLHVSLEAVHAVNDPNAVRFALRAEVHDPVWFLGRQWQLGEHRGRDAASPALVHLTTIETPLTGPTGSPEDDPRVTPPEVIIESEAEQWWTIGRRARVGRSLRTKIPATRRKDPQLLFSGLPAPYERLNSTTLDGLALYRARTALGLTDTLFVNAGVPLVEPPDDWQPAELSYSASFSAGPVTLSIPRHDGGNVDWYSASASGSDPPAAIQPVIRTSYPTRVTFPGAPHPRWWQIEDRRIDPGAVAPARTHLALLIVIRAAATHADDWYTAPYIAPSGTLASVVSMDVDDVMDLRSTNRPALDWAMFHVSGRRANELLIWPTVANPLTSATALDDVVVGVDEDANVLWAIENRVDGTDLTNPAPVAGATSSPPVAGQVVLTGNRRYRYLPSTAVDQRWHPYVSSDTGGVRRYIQARLADMTSRPAVPLPGPSSRLLRNPAAGSTDPAHTIDPAVVPRRGVRLDRRFVLGRRTDGLPTLWVQRRRVPLSAPPASGLRFDVLEEIPEIN